MEEWSCRSEIVGTRLDYKIEDFIYTWVNVELGPPGKLTNEILESSEDENVQRNQYDNHIVTETHEEL